MNRASESRLIIVWIGLVIVTTISWITGSSHSAPMQLNTAVTGVVLFISAVKARAILREFMEVRFASRTLKRLTDAWLTFTFVLLVGFYLFGKSFWAWLAIPPH
jgi:hypothetical protein